MMNDNDDSDEITFQVMNAFELQEERNEKPYDGILGSLPDWLPEPIHLDFERYRNYVLDVWQYKPAKAVKILDRWLNSSQILDKTEKYPDGRDIDSTLFTMIFGFLYKVRWALEFPPEDAINFLSGSYAESGYRSAQHLGKGRPRTKLQRLIARTISELRKFRSDDPSADEVLNSLTIYDNKLSPIIEEIDREEEKIFYIDNKGNQKPVIMRRFANIVSEELNKNK
jgi:hypothetical protein